MDHPQLQMEWFPKVPQLSNCCHACPALLAARSPIAHSASETHTHTPPLPPLYTGLCRTKDTPHSYQDPML